MQQHHLSALREERGISLIIVMAVMLVTSLLLAAAFTSARGEIHLTGRDLAAKKAYYAAQAGVQDYLSHLIDEPNYLSFCTEPSPANPALNQAGETTHRATVPGSESEPITEQYAIELLPAESAPAEDRKCDPANLVESMIEQTGPAAGSFRIESIGYAGNEERVIVATFKNVGFVSFVWFTRYETFDPSVYGEPYKSQCAAYYHSRPAACYADNFFTSGETVAGPIHTEDHVGICGEPVFGRAASDRIEFGSREEESGEGFSTEGACQSATPRFVGQHIPPERVPELEPPPGDEELQHIVEPGYEFSDRTEIVLKGETMQVTNGDKTELKSFPKNHLVYVSGGCTQAYSPFGPVPAYGSDTGCGNVYVRGEYSESLTIASQNDLIIDGNLVGPNREGVPVGTAMLGLIANNFVRIYHPLTGTRGTREGECGNAENSSADLVEPVIDAAVLALKHAVMVDNYDCGAATLGNLNTYGALAGLFSNGSTGVFEGNGTLIHGYSWNLHYDTRLLAEEPPHFLNPVRAAWEVQRETLAAKP